MRGESITDETIYQYIYKTRARRKQFVPHLTNAHKKRRKKTGTSVQKVPRIPYATSIDKRSKKINTRQTIGHWETNLMEGTRPAGQALSVHVERKSRYVTIQKVDDKTAIKKSQSIHIA